MIHGEILSIDELEERTVRPFRGLSAVTSSTETTAMIAVAGYSPTSLGVGPGIGESQRSEWWSLAGIDGGGVAEFPLLRRLTQDVDEISI